MAAFDWFPVVRFRRTTDDPKRRLWRKDRNHRYELRIDDAPVEVVDWSGLFKRLPGMKHPADFTPCVDAADELFERGDRHTWVRYPFGPEVADDRSVLASPVSVERLGNNIANAVPEEGEQETDELARLTAADPAPPDNRFHELVGFTADEPERVLTRSAAVMQVVISGSSRRPEWTLAEWLDALPPWFVEACAPEQTGAEREAWLQLFRAQDRAGRLRMEDELGWSVGDWTSAMSPDTRAWWWSSGVTSTGRGFVDVVVDGWPAPLASLEWLLQASGASSTFADTPST